MFQVVRKSHYISTTNIDRDTKFLFVNAASQQLSNALNIIILAGTIDLLESSKDFDIFLLLTGNVSELGH
jgi:hypothetical protein